MAGATLGRRESIGHLALALTARAFGDPRPLGDVRWLVHGRFQLAPAPLEDPWLRSRVLRFLAVRPMELADGPPLYRTLARVLDEAEEFAWHGDSDPSDSGWDRQWTRLPGKPLEQRIDELLAALEAPPAQAPDSRQVRTPARDIYLMGPRAGEGYIIPQEELPEPTPLPPLPTRASQDDVPVDPGSLRALADRIDAGLEGSPLYGPVACQRFLPRLEGEEAIRHPATIPAGTSQLVAPTGSGKSVFMRLQALEAAERGIPVTLVVPDIATVWRETRRLEKAARAANCHPRIAPLSGRQGFSRHLPHRLADPDTSREEEQALLERFGHACLLQAYATDTLPDWGDEPCHRLRQISPAHASGPSSSPVDCPFADRCDRFRPFRQALGADIVVTNHHAFLFGRSPRPLGDEDGIRRSPSLRELLLRQSGLVLIDEMDHLQVKLADGQSNHETLSSGRGRPSRALELTRLMETGRASPSESPGSRRSLETLRSALHDLSEAAETLAEAVGNGTLEWSGRESVTPRGQDGRLARELFGEDTDVPLSALYSEGEADSSLPAAFEPLRRLLHSLTLGLPYPEGLGEELARVRQLLEENPPARGQLPLGKLSNALVRRALLVRVDTARKSLASVAADPHDLPLEPSTTASLERFRSRMPWSISPPGPLGTHLHDYRLHGQPDNPVLESRSLAGDPHGEMAELGGLVSEVLTGHPRAVLGLSATGYFPGSPSADLRLPVWAYLPDDERTVQVRAASVDVRISGRPGPERPTAVREATRALWSRILLSHLEELERIPQEADRRRILLVTSSYEDTRHAADELRRLDSGHLAIRHVDRNGEEEGALTPASVEDFGTVSEPAVLVAPFPVIARGLNITLPRDPERSALGSIFLLTRPVSLFNEPARILRHLSYRARRNPHRDETSPNAAIAAEIRRARKDWRRFQEADPRFSRVPRALRLEMVCDTLAELVQLAGRARRGGTPARLYLVDEAFEDSNTPEAGWQHLIGELLDRWQEDGELPRMEQLHGAVLHALAEYAGRPLETLRSA